MKDDRPLLIITARVGSTRLPGKVLRPFWKNMSLLEFLLRRLQSRPESARIAVATPDSAENDPVAALAGKCGVSVVRGPEDDVVGRMSLCLKDPDISFVGRITADNPFTDPELIVAQHREMKRVEADYAYCREGVPKGTAADIWTIESFTETVKSTVSSYQREHANAWVWDHPDRYHILWYIPDTDRRAGSLNLSIDTEADYDRVRRWAERLPSPLTAGISDLVRIGIASEATK